MFLEILFNLKISCVFGYTKVKLNSWWTATKAKRSCFCPPCIQHVESIYVMEFGIGFTFLVLISRFIVLNSWWFLHTNNMLIKNFCIYLISWNGDGTNFRLVIARWIVLFSLYLVDLLPLVQLTIMYRVVFSPQFIMCLKLEKSIVYPLKQFQFVNCILIQWVLVMKLNFVRRLEVGSYIFFLIIFMIPLLLLCPAGP